ncbi:hypothetical protein N657DRAFT_93247 [Parathielavia appendiculata]|uniref:Fork-head domain-containing protein n=1 Tax=Parathielavia appendiculata TaxID=2587402 RepID=A0AAN6UC24_9PEZI|nr:hypothetical protein N657DRAFT_93247 [Parathielavia appendiculata]
MSTLCSMGNAYASPPQQMAPSCPPPNPSQAEHQLVAGLSALRSHDGDCQGAYASSLWSSCLGSQTSNDEFEHYTLHTSPTVSSLQQTSSEQSSPRIWDSPEQLGPTPWEAATEQVQNRYRGLDPQLSSYQLPDSGYNIPTSFPADASLLQAQGLNGQEEWQRARSQTEPYPAGYHTLSQDGYPASPESGRPLSPCSTAPRFSMENGASDSPGDDVKSQAETLVGMEDARTRTRKRSPSLSHVQADGSTKQEEPYAQLIYKAFLSTPRHAMTLQEIYQWFRENTDKGKDDTKGWQNSIRHNLSMNQAFTKRERRPSAAKDGDASQTDGKKSTEWYLEPWAIAGVQSTTRYRKGNQSRRSAASHGLHSRVYRSYPARHHQHHHHHSFSKRGQGHGSSRVLRGARSQTLRSNSSTSMRQQQQSYLLSPHRSSPYISHGIHQHHLVINNPVSSVSPAPHTAPPSFFPRQHYNSPTNTTNTGIEYDYPDPQLFPPGTSSSSMSMVRSTSSEPCAADNEPVTPESLHAVPYAAKVGGDGGLMMDGGQGDQYHYTGYHAYFHPHHQQNAAAAAVTVLPQVVGVYDDDSMEGVVGPLHHHPGWVGSTTTTGVLPVGVNEMVVKQEMDGMAVCGGGGGGGGEQQQQQHLDGYQLDGVYGIGH